MTDLTNIQDVLAALKTAQEADHDNRETAREAHLFVSKRNGQWESHWWNANADKPRYTFDMTNPVVKQVYGELSQADFAGTVEPMSGDASKETAQTYEGLIRNIQSISNAKHVYNAGGKGMIIGGLDGWEVVQKYVDADSFEQDLAVEKVHNFIDRVWFGPSEEQDRSDCKMAWKLQGFTKADYKKKWPEGSQQSVSTDAQSQAYYNKNNLIMVGVFYYIKELERELVLMSNGKVYEDNEDYQKIKDELAALNVTEVRRRKRNNSVVYTRKFDARDWLADEEATVFQWIPLIPTFGNYSVFENKTLYWGVVEKIIDPQRVLNYSKSREIEEGALAPRAKYWMTEKQTAGHEETLGTLNTNADPVQLFNHDENYPGVPQQNGGAQINPGLQNISAAMTELIAQQSNMHAVSRGDNPGLQSGVAIKQLQDKGDIGSIEYFQSQEIAICHTMRILIKAAPKVYAPGRQVRLLKEDGSFDMVTLGQEILDEETGQKVILNDLSAGTYDVTCSAGKAFQNKQQETVSGMIEIGQVDPSVIQLGGDVLLKNVMAPGMDLVAARKRAELFKQGLIPEDQMTEEEKAIMQAQAQQPQQPSADMLIGQAELMKAQNEETKTLIGVQKDKANIQLAAMKEEREAASAEFKQFIEMQKLQVETNKAETDVLTQNVETLTKLLEANLPVLAAQQKVEVSELQN